MRAHLRVQSGTIDDVPAAQAMIEEARNWLRARTIDQWQDPIPDATIARDAVQGNLFMAWNGGSVVGMITVSDSDPEIWGADVATALYVHRLAAARAHRGKDIGGTLLDWARHRAASQGRSAIRLDCAADNPGLRRFYEARHFQHVRDILIPSPAGSRVLETSLYERQLGW